MRANLVQYDAAFPHNGNVLAVVEAETFDLCRAALILSGELRSGSDGFYYGAHDQRVVIRWLNDHEQFYLSQENL